MRPRCTRDVLRLVTYDRCEAQLKFFNSFDFALLFRHPWTCCRFCCESVPSRARFAYAVGARGFEPPTSWSQTTRSTKLSYAPNLFYFKLLQRFFRSPDFRSCHCLMILYDTFMHS